MGNRNTTSSLKNAIVLMNISADHFSVHDDKFWSQIWQEDMTTAAEVIKSISTQEIRMLRDGSPRNFSTLTYVMVEKLRHSTSTLCNTQSQQAAVLIATRVLVRLIPCVFEDHAWRGFFANNRIQETTAQPNQEPVLIFPQKSYEDRNYESYLPLGSKRSTADSVNQSTSCCDDAPQFDLLNGVTPTENPDGIGDVEISESLMKSLIISVCDLLFCPEFTVLPHSDNHLATSVDAPPEDLKSLATIDYVWEPGVGFDSKVNSTTYYDKSREELLRLLLTCLSGTLYESPDSSISRRNEWIEIFASKDNRHTLPLFTSLLNTIFTYKPPTLLPFNKVLFEDNREKLVELCIQLMIATLDHNRDHSSSDDRTQSRANLFIEFMSRIHRNEDFAFLVRGFTRLLNMRLTGSSLLGATKLINFDQELLILFWKLCDFNAKFMSFLLNTNDVLDIVVPTLYHLSENFQDSSKTGLIHIGVFNLLILSGERNFGVRLNKAYESNIIPNIPNFTGSHADLMIIVFHKLILYGLNLNQLYDFLMTIMVNISPYLKSLSTLACRCLIQLFEIFSSPFVIMTEPNYHQLVVFLLEIFNNLIQYQFDGNATLIYVIISKKEAFLKLANLPTNSSGIDKILNKLKKKRKQILQVESDQQTKAEEMISSQNSDSNQGSQEVINKLIGAKVSSADALQSRPANQQEVSLVATPDICNVTHPIRPFEVNESVFDFRQPIEEPSINFEDAIDPNSLDSTQTSQQADSDCGNKIETDAETQITEEFGLNIDGKESSSDVDSKWWRPSPDWVKRYKVSLPLHSILRMIEVLEPQMSHLKGPNSQIDEIAAVKFLQASTLVGLLPVPHPILIRKYRTNNQTALWFRACTWGMIFVRNRIWTGTDVKLIKVV